MHRLLLHNDQILDTHAQCLSPGQTGLLNGWGVFSTVRIEGGVLFEFERHWRRMHEDAVLLHVPFPKEPEWMHARLLQLVDANRAYNATLRVVVVRNRGGLYEGPDQTHDFDLIAFTTDINEWGDSVRLALKPNGRYAQSEFSGAKILSWAQNLTWYEEAHQRGFDEYVLLNERGEVAECTSANIFTVEGSKVFTPPLKSGCLPGVTRELLLHEIHIADFQILEKTLMPSDLARADQVLITSSTRDLLPASYIEGFDIRNQSTAAQTLSRAFREYREAYVRKHARHKVSA